MQLRLLALLAALAVGIPTRVHAAPTAVRKDFANPLRVPGLTAHLESEDNYPFPTCSNQLPATKVAFTFELADAMKDLRVYIGDPRSTHEYISVVVFPDGSSLCLKDRPYATTAAWPRGRYQVYLLTNWPDAPFAFELEDPARSKVDVAAAAAAAPVIEISDENPVNPQLRTVPRTVVALAGDVLDCLEVRDAVTPVAVLDVKRPADDLYLDDGVRPILTLEGSRRCLTWDSHPTRVKLAPGRYTLWAKTDRWLAPEVDRATYDVELDDRTRAVGFAPVTATPVGTLAEPLILAGTLRAPEHVAARVPSMCERAVAQAPDLVVTTTRPLVHVKARALFAEKTQDLVLYGPLERGADAEYACADLRRGDRGDDVELDRLDGTYAIWIDGGGAAPGTGFQVALTAPETTVDPLRRVAEPRAGLPIWARAIDFHYPFLVTKLEGDAPFRLFTESPEALFVYARADFLDSGSHEDHTGPAAESPIAGEPLLVVWAHGGKARVQTHDGVQYVVDDHLLTDTRPAELHFRPAVRTIDAFDVDAAIAMAGPEDRKGVAAFEARREKWRTCYNRYMAGHDPGWGKDVEVYRVGGGGAVNLGSAASDQADRKCGSAKQTRAENALYNRLEQHRAKRRAAWFAAVKRRFTVR